ncbi:MAG: M23 family metallopeptidase [Hungatella sp.]
MMVILILLLSVFQVTVMDYLIRNPDYYQLDAYTVEQDAFRSMILGEMLVSQTTFDYDLLTTAMIEQEFDLTKFNTLTYENKYILKHKSTEYGKLKKAYESIFRDLKYFPIPKSSRSDTPPITFSNDWMNTRTYGGKRGHEGCDIMGNERERGYYPVVSITDGTVEKIGWLEQGGWRIGIRSPSGLYLYYAHLYGYSKKRNVGDFVQAGELLGFMGDSGYGKTEGTVGNFDVHLHLGLYLKTPHHAELSINPYWILKYLQKNQLKYHY